MEKLRRDARVVVQDQHRLGAVLQRRTDAGIVAAGVAAVLRQAENGLIGKALADEVDRPVARAVVDHRTLAPRSRPRQALETGDGLARAVPVEHDDGDVLRLHAVAAQPDAVHPRGEA
jgi:hypothetical protein